MTSAGGAASVATLDQRRQNWLLIGVSLAFVVSFFFSDLLTRDANDMPALWPVNAIAAAGLLRLTPGRQAILWAICIVTRLISHQMAGDSWLMILVYTSCDSTETLVAMMIARRVTRGTGAVRSVGRALLLVAAVFPLTALMAAIGSGLASATRGLPFLEVYRGWLSCTALGMAIALPATLVILDPQRRFDFRQRSPAVQAGLYLIVALMTTVAFGGAANPMPFLIFPAAMLAAFQLGPKGAAWSSVIVIMVAAPLTVAGYGPTTINPAWTETDRIRMVQAFVTTLFFTSLASALSLHKEDRLKHLMARRSAAARAARARAQAASQAKSDFLATISHEIRTPLNSILGFSSLLGATETLSPEGQRKLDLIAGAGQSLVTIVNDVLDFSRIEAGQIQLDPTPVSPAALLRDTAGIIAPDAEAKGLSVEIGVAEDAADLYALDESRLRQVLLNLLNNAVKFTPSGGIVARLTVDRRDDDASLLFEVADTGIGVAPDQQERLFQRFSQADNSIRRSFGGTGLGLAICKALVTLMGGEIGLRSAAGAGSTFWLRIPAQLAIAAPVEDEIDREGAVARILLVDDHPMNRELGKAMLVLAGCEVETADDGDEAVRIASEGDFDLILMDIHMPRMDGLAASVAIRALPCPSALAPIIALSADVMPQQIERCMKAGMVDHIAKPIDRAALYATINRWLAPDPLAA